MRIFISGSSGYLGQHIVQNLLACTDHSLLLLQHNKPPLAQATFRVQIVLGDLRESPAWWEQVREFAPDVVLHLGAVASTKICEQEPDAAHAINVTASSCLGSLANAIDARFIFISTDWVFDALPVPDGGFREDSTTASCSVYGQSKCAAEDLLKATCSKLAIVRCALIYGSAKYAVNAHIEWMSQTLEAGQALSLFTDEWRTPVCVTDVARLVRKVIDQELEGIFHCAGVERISRYEFGRRFAVFFNFPQDLVKGVTRAAAGMENRPADLSLSTLRTSEIVGFRFHSIEQAFDLMKSQGKLIS